MADDGKTMIKNVVKLPVRALSMASGMAIGIPVAIMRRSGNRCIEYNNSIADSIGGKEHGPPQMIASVIGIPAGLVVGTGEGFFYGGKNAVNKSVDHPFCLASMSLDEKLE